MENVQFEEGQERNTFMTRKNQVATVSRFFIKIGLAKNQQQANGVMVVVSIISLLLMTYFLMSVFAPGTLPF